MKPLLKLTLGSKMAASMQIPLSWLVVSLLITYSMKSVKMYDVDYTGCTVYRIRPESSEIMKVLHRLYKESLMEQLNGTFHRTEVETTRRSMEFWNHPDEYSRHTTLHVCSDKKPVYESWLHRLRVPYKIQMEDLQKVIDRERRELNSRILYLREDHPRSFTRDQYHKLQEIYAFLEAIEAHNPNSAQLRTIGKSVKGRPIKVIKISSGDNCPKPAVWIDCGIHAREWISPATCMWMIYQLMYVEADSDAQTLKSMYDWHFLPVVNPDGYDHSWNSNRMWRKSLAQTRRCAGVDLNRNFNADWKGGQSSSNSPCSNNYRGARPFSEPETIAIRNEILQLKDDLKIYLSMHSYGQMWLYPYSYKKGPSEHRNDLHRLAEKAVKAAQMVNGTVYKHGPSATTIYVASGTSKDWVHDSAGIKYAYTIELRDKGNHGFMLPSKKILPTAEETWQGVVAALYFVAKEYDIPVKQESPTQISVET